LRLRRLLRRRAAASSLLDTARLRPPPLTRERHPFRCEGGGPARQALGKSGDPSLSGGQARDGQAIRRHDAAAFGGTLGFDPTVPADVRTHGFDDQGGVGFFVLPGKSSPVFVVAIADPERAQQTVQRIFEGIEERETGEKLVFETRAVPSGDGVTVVRRARGDLRAAYRSCTRDGSGSPG